MEPAPLVLGFLPWIAFTVISHRTAADAVAWSALVAVSLTAVAVVLARRRHAPVVLDAVSLGLFAVIAAVGFAGGARVDDWLSTWGRPLVGVALGCFVLATAPIRPFTAEYARRSTPEQLWSSPAFRSVNRILSAAWGAGLVVIGAAGVLVTLLDEEADGRTSPHLADLVLNWLVPIAVVWGLVSFSRSYPGRVSARLHGGADGRRVATHRT